MGTNISSNYLRISNRKLWLGGTGLGSGKTIYVGISCGCRVVMGGGTIDISFGLSSTSSSGTGIQNINFRNTMGSAYYAVGATAHETSGGTNTAVCSVQDTTVMTTSSVQIVAEDADGAYINAPYLNVVVIS